MEELNSDLLELNLSKPIPDHTDEIIKAIDFLREINEDFNNNQNITDYHHELLYEKTVKLLYYVGCLSLKIFELQPEIIELYTMKFLRDPAVGKELYYKHYHQLHRKYNLIKNKCFKLLDNIDEKYILLNKKLPPNYNSNNFNFEENPHQDIIFLNLLDS